MSEVTEGELVVWSVDPGPMAGVLERQLWRMATAARSYLNRMRAAELAHGVAAGERVKHGLRAHGVVKLVAEGFDQFGIHKFEVR